MKIWMLAALAALCFLPATTFSSDAALIKDMESLRNSLPFKDAGRPQLTRRLADLYFQKAVEDDKNLLLTGKGNAGEIKRLRERAYKLYQESLTGENGIFPAATGELKVKTQFQLARLDRMSGEKARAFAAFREVASSPSSGPDLLRETHLTIAEMQDEDGQWKEAMASYQAALPLCQGPSATGYVQHRIAWALYRMNRFTEAQHEIAKALWDAQGQPKEQVFRDYIQFLASTPATNGQVELSRIEPLAQKAGLPLVENLAEAFFAVGNRTAGATVMAHAHRLAPNAFYSARLAEEYYGFRRWDDLRSELSTLQSLSAQIPALDEKKRTALDQILRRLIVQIDGERKSNPGKYNEESCAAIDLHLSLFPKSDVVAKMQEGWLAAQTDESMKMQRLATWIQEAAARKDNATELRFRTERAALASRKKDYAVIISEASALAALSPEKEKQREWMYVAAKAMQDMGKEEEALNEYRSLATVEQNASPDKWAVQSQHLALAILNKGKRYQELAQQAALWTGNKTLAANTQMKTELAEMSRAESEARFEAATAMGENPEALSQFLSFCEAGEFKEKACTNAKVLAVKLKKNDELIRVLKVLGDEETLASEYERTGRFTQAAALLEKKLVGNKDETSWLKVSLLYEIGGDKTSQVRVLRSLAAAIKKAGKFTPGLEPVLETSFLAAGMSATELMPLPWSTTTKLRLAATFEDKGMGNTLTQKLVSSSDKDLGVSWAKMTISRLEEMDKKQKSISFQGRNSTALFQKRLKAIGSFAEATKKILSGASTEVRVYLLERLAAAYTQLEQEIMATPMPEGLEQEQIVQVQAAMESLAAPLKSEAVAYQKLQEEQYIALGDKAASWREIVPQGREVFVTKLTEQVNAPVEFASGMTEEQRAEVLNQLSMNPSDRSLLEKLHGHYSARGEIGPAAYFKGRLSNVETNL